MQQLLYRSIARDEEFSDSDLDILLTALSFNSASGVTGFLWRGSGQFYQALHGRRDILTELMSRIEADERHSEVEVLLIEDAPSESPFADWAMGYDYLAEEELGIGLGLDGQRPPIGLGKAREVWSRMAEQAQAEGEFGSAFPYARKPGESIAAWKRRLDAVRMV